MFFQAFIERFYETSSLNYSAKSLDNKISKVDEKEKEKMLFEKIKQENKKQ